MQKLTIALASGVAAFAMTIPAHAQFAVIDAAQGVNATTQISHEVEGLARQAEQIAEGKETNLTLTQQLLKDVEMAGTALKIYNQSVTTYNTIFNSTKYFDSKSVWRTTENALMSQSVQNSYGETAGLQAQLNGQSQNPSMVWKIMNLAISGTSPSFWSQQVVGQSDRLATLAHIEAMDAASSQCLGAVGAYQAGRAANLPSNTALDSSIYDTSGADNTEGEQLNLLNMADAQQMQESHAQGQLHACMAAQAAVANMDKRNEASITINDANYKITQQANNPTYAGNESTTWTTYY